MRDVSDSLPEELRREAFAALVAAQDRGISVSESRRVVAAQFVISAADTARIEREGLDNDWLPL